RDDPRSGGFLQVSGLRFEYDSDRPAGSRIVSVTLDDGTPIPPDQSRYSAATNDFLNGGGDGYTMLADGAGVTRELMADVLLDHIRAAGTVRPATEGRIRDIR
ncbi:MAG TPA: 5'-nucleotidase C-terminal domain-containing protein, partial [Actinomycetota bacterium]|nr:5'-nucleotidase C-terminal domain-containing protein [Actinomycetota bacterium]